MKKIVLLFVLVTLFSIGNLSAQCVPAVFPGPALTNPDTSDGIPIAYVGTIYDEQVDVRVPLDTIIFGTSISIDSIGVDSISGVPNTFTYSTNSPSDFWIGGTFGCLTVQGLPTDSDTGVYKLILHARIFIGHNAANTQLHDVEFEFIIKDSSTVGFENNNSNKFEVLQNAPNPFVDETVIRFQSPNANNYSFQVYSIAGRLIREGSIDAKKGINQLTFYREGLSSGVYIYEISDGNISFRKRMIIQ